MLSLLITVSLFAGGAKDKAQDGASGSKGTSGAQKHYVFGFTNMDLTTSPGKANEKAMRTLVEARGDTFYAVDGQLDQSKQNNAIEDLITRGIDVMILQPVDSQSVTPILNALKAAGVIVINYDSAVQDRDLIATFISTNSYQAGQIVADEMIKTFPNGAKLAIIENPLAESVTTRVKGMTDKLEGSKIQIVDRKSITSYAQVLGTTEDMMQAHPDLNAMYGLNDAVSLTMLGAVQSAGLQNKIKIFSVDGSPEGKVSISKGGLYATAAQPLKAMGEKSVEMAYKALAGEKLEKEYLVDAVMIDQNNIKQFKLDEWE